MHSYFKLLNSSKWFASHNYKKPLVTQNVTMIILLILCQDSSIFENRIYKLPNEDTEE